MTNEEQIQTIINVLFENTTTEQLPLEKCYELAEKIVEKFRPRKKRGASRNLRHRKTLGLASHLELFSGSKIRKN